MAISGFGLGVGGVLVGGRFALGKPVWSQTDLGGPLFSGTRENVPTLAPRIPLFLAQGEADFTIGFVSQAAYVADRCENGERIDYRTYPRLDHMPLVAPISPFTAELFDRTSSTLAGEGPGGSSRG